MDCSASNLTSNRKAWQTVLLAIFVLCVFGAICSFPTNWLHRIILWFAPINSTLFSAVVRYVLKLLQSLHRFASVSHCSFLRQTNKVQNGYSRQSWTDPDGRAKASPSCLGALIPSDKMQHISNMDSFLSVAWTMTDYDGTTQ